jgi:hypothetical protein
MLLVSDEFLLGGVIRYLKCLVASEWEIMEDDIIVKI